MGEVKRAAGYIRVSTAEQSTKGLSIETQIAEIKAYAEYHKMKLVDIYIDRGITARKSLEKRVDFMRMMGDVQKRKINHIIVLRLDRFFRNVFDYHKMMNEYLTPNNCDWSAVKEQYTTTTTNGRLMINLRLAIAEQECDTDSDRIKDVFENRVKNGYVISGSVPWGYKIENKRIIIDPEKREIFEDMIEYIERSSSVTGTLTYMQNTHGISFCYGTLSRLFKNPILYGSYRGNDNFCEGILTKERFVQLRRLLDKNIRQRKSNHSYMFSGLVVCGRCNHSMAGSTTHGYSYYRCTDNSSNKRCKNGASTNELAIEKHLLENFEKELKNFIADVELEERNRKPIKSNRKAIEQKLQRLNRIFVNGNIEEDQYQRDYDALKSQIIDEPKIVKKDLTAYKKLLESDFRTIYKTRNFEEKRAFWRSVISYIEVDDREVKDFKILRPWLE